MGQLSLSEQSPTHTHSLSLACYQSQQIHFFLTGQSQAHPIIPTQNPARGKWKVTFQSMSNSSPPCGSLGLQANEGPLSGCQVEAIGFSSPACRNSSFHSQVSCQNTQAQGSIIINLPPRAPINVSLKQPIFLHQFPPLWYTGHVSEKSEAIHILSYIRRSHVEMSLHYQDSHVKRNRLSVNVSNLTMLMEPLDILSPHLFLRCLSRRQLQESFQALGSPVYVY